MCIKHIVFSGGGPIGITVYGILQKLHEAKFWDMDNIESIYGTSAGGMLAVILCLKFDWDIINTYFVKRPWHEAFPFHISQCLDVFSKKGLLDHSYFEIFFKPLLDAKNISLSVTMLEFFNYTNIELHLYTLELNENKLCEITHKTFPDLPLLKAIQMTSSIPMLFMPVCIEDKCYIDGGILNNYPLNYCVQDHPNIEEIMAFKNDYVEDEKNAKINVQSNLFEFVMLLCNQILFNIPIKQIDNIPNEIMCKADLIGIDYFKQTLISEPHRQNLLNIGFDIAEKHLQKMESKDKDKDKLKDKKE